MKISKIAKKGTVNYTHYYNQTMTGAESAEHTLDCPKAITTLARKHPDATAIVYGDDTLGIEINGKAWAVEDPHPPERTGKKLPKEVWHYINIAMGREEYRNTYSN